MKSKFAVGIITALLLTAPLVVFGADGDTTVKSVVATFTTVVVRAIMGLFIATAVAAFFYGIVRYILGIREGNEEQVRKGNQFIVWGLVSLFVMASAWGIVSYAQNILGIDTKRTIVIPNANIR